MNVLALEAKRKLQEIAARWAGGASVGIVNYNNDVAEYWERSDTGFLPVDFTNEAYKLGVNYIVYALTH